VRVLGLRFQIGRIRQALIQYSYSFLPDVLRKINAGFEKAGFTRRSSHSFRS
jgi:hypothetical protein